MGAAEATGARAWAVEGRAIMVGSTGILRRTALSRRRGCIDDPKGEGEGEVRDQGKAEGGGDGP